MLFFGSSFVELIGLGLIVFLIALLPTRRLYMAGFRPRALLTYLIVLIALGLVIVELRIAARFLIPIAVIAYIAPFVTAPVVEFLRPNPRIEPPARDVTPRDRP